MVGEAWRNANGEPERDGGLPAVISYDRDSGEPVLKVWYFQGEKHREDGPAFEKIDTKSGIVVTEAWHVHGKLHRAGDKPARIFRCPETGNAIEEVYATNGVFDRAGDPAVLRYDPQTGRIVKREYWRNGERATKPSAMPGPA